MSVTWAPKSHAAVTIVCVDMDFGEQLWDASPRDYPAEGPPTPPSPAGDYLETEGRLDNGDYPFPMQYWLVRVINEKTDERWGFMPLDEDGCTEPITFDEEDEEQTFRLEYVRWAQLSNDREIIGYDCDDLVNDGDGRPEVCIFGLPGGNPEQEAGTTVVMGIEPVPANYTHVTIEPYFDNTDDDHPNAGDDVILSPVEYTLWAATFAEDRIPMWPEGGFQTYIGTTRSSSDENVFGMAASAANWNIGGQLTLQQTGRSYRRKFVTAHEYGHIVTARMYEMVEADYDYAGPGGVPDAHKFDSVEYQSAASIEGFAHVYALWTWSPPGQAVVYIPDPELNVRMAIPLGGSITPSPFCGNNPDCGPGLANERDWATALHVFRQEENMSTVDVLHMLGAVYDGGSGWVATGQTAAFWNHWVSQMGSYLTTQQLETWEDVAEAWYIDN
jgi:hypothetical protein